MNKKKNKKPHHHPKTNPKPKVVIPDPPSVDMSATEPTKHDAVVAKQPTDKPASQKGSEMEKIRWTDRLIAAATVVIAIATIVQGYELVTGSTDTHKLAESTLAASRAWVVIQGTSFGITKDKGYPTGRVVLADSGNSPAFGIEGWRCAEIRSAEPPIANGQLQKSPTGICFPITGGVLGRGVPIGIDTFVPSPLPEGFARNTEDSGPRYYVWGALSYDIYPKDVRHSISFCLTNAGEQMGPCKEGGYNAD